MNDKYLTLEEFKQALLEAAGQGEVDLGGDILDVEFQELGYDSIALLETSGRLERRFGVSFDDDTIASARTPRALLGLINEQLQAVS
jgi:acyl carrier protein